jgi:PPOX class probable FMN-dependent enzyme
MSKFIISSKQQLREIYSEPSDGAIRKVLQNLDKHCLKFLEKSPFCIVSTSNSEGKVDASPKGGKPGFLHVVNKTTILLPDWPGNNRLDSFENIIENPKLGMLVLIPGISETLRINGSAILSTDPNLKKLFIKSGKTPLSVVIITINEVYVHCARAIWRSDLWKHTHYLDKSEFPSMGEILSDQIAGYEAKEIDTLIENNRYKLYSEGT